MYFIDRITDTQENEPHVVTVVFDGSFCESRFFFDNLAAAQALVREAKKMGAIDETDFVTIAPVTIPVGGDV